MSGVACNQIDSWLSPCHFEARHAGDKYLGDICTRCGEWLPYEAPNSDGAVPTKVGYLSDAVATKVAAEDPNG